MTDPAHFEQLYDDAVDPWQLAEREYERRKYALTVASLPNRRYVRAFEPACSIGVLTALLADRCDAVLATDPASSLDEARRRVPDQTVTFARGSVPHDWPTGSFDLIVLSELLYYLDERQRLDVLARALDSLEPQGHLVLVHWRHDFDVAASTGDVVHDEVASHSEVRTVVSHVEDDFRLEVFAHAGG